MKIEITKAQPRLEGKVVSCAPTKPPAQVEAAPITFVANQIPAVYSNGVDKSLGDEDRGDSCEKIVCDQTASNIQPTELHQESLVSSNPLTAEEAEENPETFKVAPEQTIGGTGYGGDLLDNSKPLLAQGYETLKFETAHELLLFANNNLLNGRVTLHPWQIETLTDLSFANPTDQKPYRFCLCAANGSGKDLFVIAPFVIWFACTKVRSLCVITSSSGQQMTSQTENHIANLARDINAKFQEVYGKPIFKITRRFVKCLLSGSEIRMFVTDEAGKAEGYHPLEPGAEMAIIVNEAKTVAPEIFGALSRCTGYNYWLNVSTPGEPSGNFHYSYHNWQHRRKVTAFDCPHASMDHIENLKKEVGEFSAIYRSQVLAEFTAVGGSVVVNTDSLDKLIRYAFAGVVRSVKVGRKRIGADLSASAAGDENAFICVQGNTIIDSMFFREQDTTKTADAFAAFIHKHTEDVAPEVYADDGGVGRGIIDQVVLKGYSVTRVMNQSRAFRRESFRNRGAEMWFNFARIVEEKAFFWQCDRERNEDDKKLYDQLTNRHYKKGEALATYTLLSKPEEKEEYKLSSPDRADALVLAFSGVNWEELVELSKPVKRDESARTIEELMSDKRAEHRRAILGGGEKGKDVNGSMEVFMAANRRN